MNIKLGEPVVVAQCPRPSVEGKIPWGEYQFPDIEITAEGYLHASYHINADSATAYGKPKGHALSYDGGKTWSPCKKDEGYTGGPETGDGSRIRIFDRIAANPEDIELPEKTDAEKTFWGVLPQFYYSGRFGDDFNAWSVERRSADGQWESQVKPARLPCNAARYVIDGVMPYNMLWRIRIAPDGTVWGVAYPFFINGYKDKTVMQPAFVVSEDNGETFRFLSTIPYQPAPSADPFYDKRDGFTEPDVAFLPDGTVMCIMRTQDSNGNGPSYVCYSRDNGKHWSMPEIFDDLGVWANLLTLKCGVTLASYGRPGVYIRATSDPAGKKWDPRIQILDPGTPSCSYTGITAAGDRSAVMVYSHFNYRGGDGVPRKTILARTIEIDVR